MILSQRPTGIRKVDVTVKEIYEILEKLLRITSILNNITIVDGGIEIGSDPPVRLIWEDDRLKCEVYGDGTWHTCIKGGY